MDGDETPSVATPAAAGAATTTAKGGRTKKEMPAVVAAALRNEEVMSSDARAAGLAAAKAAPGFMEVGASGAPGLLHSAAMSTLVFIVIHYLFWFPTVVVALVGLYYVLGGGVAGGVAVALPVAAYLPSFLDGCSLKLGRPWDALRMWSVWSLGHDYVGMRVRRTAALDAAKKYVFGWHPHGIIVLSRLSVYGGFFERLFPGLDTRTLGASPMFAWPGAREISLWLGGIDASPRVANGALAAGKSLIIYPGGTREIYMTDPASDVTELELSSRLGFVRLAMQHGASLVPVVVYGERQCYTPVHLPPWLRSFLYRIKMPALVFYGRWFTLMPNHARMAVVYGAPVEVPHVPDISKDDPRIAESLAAYMTALRTLWETHKTDFGYAPTERLHIT